MTRPAITRRQRDILRFFEEYTQEQGISPTLEEIAQHFGLNKVTIFGHVTELERKGILRRSAKGVSRGLQIVQENEDGTLEPLPDGIAGNEAEVAAAISLANRYPDVVTSVSVGNETQVYWSWHKSPMEDLLGYLREVRAGVRVPVTTISSQEGCGRWASARMISTDWPFFSRVQSGTRMPSILPPTQLSPIRV